jgi:uncharacterized membrane protein YgcG
MITKPLIMLSSILAFAAAQVMPSLEPSVLSSLATDSTAMSRFQSRVATYIDGLATDTKIISVNSVLETAVPETMEFDKIALGDRQLTTESWFQAMPTDVKSYIYSIASEELRLLTDSNDVGPTGSVPKPSTSTSLSSSSDSSSSSGSSSSSKATGSSSSSSGSSTNVTTTSTARRAGNKTAEATGKKSSSGTESVDPRIWGQVLTAGVLLMVVAFL